MEITLYHFVLTFLCVWIQADLHALTTEKIDYEAETKSAGGQSVIGSSTEDIVVDVRRYYHPYLLLLISICLPADYSTPLSNFFL